MTEATSIDLDVLARMALARSGSRTLIAIAGAPGSGKSTVAEHFAARLNAEEAGAAAVLPMDGYHFDDSVLIARGQRARKGAPETFDVAGFGHMLARLRRNDEAEVAVPVFDRDLEISRAGARIIPRSVRLLVVEGNYLLLKEGPWSSLRPMFDVTVMLAVPEAELRRRLTARWAGYDFSAEAIAAKLDDLDLPNGRFIAANSIEPDFLLRNVSTVS